MIQAIPQPATLKNIRRLMLEGTVRSKQAQVTEGWETHNGSGHVESKKAAIELVQAVSGLSTVFGIITRRDGTSNFVSRSERARVLKGGGKDKPSSSNPTLDQRALVVFMSAVQSTIRPSNRQALLPHFQEIQYLSRSQFTSPPLSAVALNASGPVVTVVDAVTQQWQGLHDDQLLVANPTFVAAPNAIYHGVVQLPSGQVLHRSTALNTFHLSRNGATPAEDIIDQPITTVSPLVLGITIVTGMMRVAEDIGEIERPKTPNFETVGQRAAQHELAHEIHRCAKDSLKLDGDDLFDSDSDAESMPVLESASSSDESSLFSVELGLCNLYFKSHHPATCPLIESALQQVLRDRETAASSEEPTELHRVLDAALGPFLSEWVNLPEPKPMPTSIVAAHEARQAFHYIL
ncbi:hypothetical protein K438DRAFT_1785071 [Mycena galopus ATCC 62051]|nr:hypothetical protein K438DRAFT_1785071 [Mycena galopus ATCC 62051]